MEYNLEKEKREQEMREKQEASDAKRKKSSMGIGNMTSMVPSGVSNMASSVTSGVRSIGKSSRRAGRRAQQQGAKGGGGGGSSSDGGAGSAPASPEQAVESRTVSDVQPAPGLGGATLALEQCVQEHCSAPGVLSGEITKVSNAAKAGALSAEMLDSFLLIALGSFRNSQGAGACKLRQALLQFASACSSSLQ